MAGRLREETETERSGAGRGKGGGRGGMPPSMISLADFGVSAGQLRAVLELHGPLAAALRVRAPHLARGRRLRRGAIALGGMGMDWVAGWWKGLPDPFGNVDGKPVDGSLVNVPANPHVVIRTKIPGI